MRDLGTYVYVVCSLLVIPINIIYLNTSSNRLTSCNNDQLFTACTILSFRIYRKRFTCPLRQKFIESEFSQISPYIPASFIENLSYNPILIFFFGPYCLFLELF